MVFEVLLFLGTLSPLKAPSSEQIFFPNCICQGSSKKQNVCTHMIYFRELAHLIVWAGESQIPKTGKQAGNSGGRMLRS